MKRGWVPILCPEGYPHPPSLFRKRGVSCPDHPPSKVREGVGYPAYPHSKKREGDPLPPCPAQDRVPPPLFPSRADGVLRVELRRGLTGLIIRKRRGGGDRSRVRQGGTPSPSPKYEGGYGTLPTPTPKSEGGTPYPPVQRKTGYLPPFGAGMGARLCVESRLMGDLPGGKKKAGVPPVFAKRGYHPLPLSKI
jgi:hypothetical protein